MSQKRTLVPIFRRQTSVCSLAFVTPPLFTMWYRPLNLAGFARGGRIIRERRREVAVNGVPVGWCPITIKYTDVLIENKLLLKSQCCQYAFHTLSHVNPG